MLMRIIITNKKSFQVIEWINIVSVRISGANWIVTNSSGVSSPYPLDTYNVRILGVQ